MNESLFDREKLKKLREQKGLSLYELALELSVERSALSRLESGISRKKKSSSRPSFELVARIAEYFKVPMSYFIKPVNDLQ